MPERKRLVAGNWKMNMLRADGAALARAIAERARREAGGIAAICSCVRRSRCSPRSERRSPAAASRWAARTAIRTSGAFTGCVSAEMLKDAGCGHAIVGHSERRHGCGETDADIRAKTEAAWRAGLVAIVCVGETRAEREAGARSTSSRASSPARCRRAPTAERLVVAYEPVWAIGTGLTPTIDDIAAMHEAIRGRIPPGTRILYGGSVNPKNAAEILALADVDGALVGGASLKADDFWAIAQAAG